MAEIESYVRSDQLQVLVVPEMAEDAEACAVADRIIRAAGRCALGATVEDAQELQQTHSKYPTLMHAIFAASLGDPVAHKVVVNNVQTDVIERTTKSGHIMSLPLEVDERGNILQHGQLMRDVYINTLRFASDIPQMRRRAEAEARNGSRIHLYRERGLLDAYNFVVFSCAADDMCETAMAEAGFFTDDMSCAIQVTTKNSVESAFAAGKAAPESARHDIQTVVRLAAFFGVDLSGKSATEILNTPLLIPKYMMPNGVADIVKLYDIAAGGTFFGKKQEAQDYLDYLQVCRRREETMEPRVKKIVAELLNAAPTVTSPLQATQLLHELSQKHMLDHALTDTSINPLVFGAVSARYIEEARFHLAMGDHDAFLNARNSAQRTAVSSSCPGAARGDREGGGTSGDSQEGEQRASSSSSESGACEYTHSGCYCSPYDDLGNKLPVPKVVKAYRNERGEATCMRMGCNAAIDAKGKKIRFGDIYELAMKKEAEAMRSRIEDVYEADIAGAVDEAFAEQGVASFEDAEREMQGRQAQHVGAVAAGTYGLAA